VGTAVAHFRRRRIVIAIHPPSQSAPQPLCMPTRRSSPVSSFLRSVAFPTPRLIPRPTASRHRYLVTSNLTFPLPQLRSSALLPTAKRRPLSSLPALTASHTRNPPSRPPPCIFPRSDFPSLQIALSLEGPSLIPQSAGTSLPLLD
jgi:hypothetical protein